MDLSRNGKIGPTASSFRAAPRTARILDGGTALALAEASASRSNTTVDAAAKSPRGKAEACTSCRGAADPHNSLFAFAFGQKEHAAGLLRARTPDPPARTHPPPCQDIFRPPGHPTRLPGHTPRPARTFFARQDIQPACQDIPPRLPGHFSPARTSNPPARTYPPGCQDIFRLPGHLPRLPGHPGDRKSRTCAQTCVLPAGPGRLDAGRRRAPRHRIRGCGRWRRRVNGSWGASRRVMRPARSGRSGSAPFRRRGPGNPARRPRSRTSSPSTARR